MESSRCGLVRKGVSFSFSKFCTFCERWIESRLGMLYQSSEFKRICHNSNCKMPGPLRRVYDTGPRHQLLKAQVGNDNTNDLIAFLAEQRNLQHFTSLGALFQMCTASFLKVLWLQVVFAVSSSMPVVHALVFDTFSFKDWIQLNFNQNTNIRNLKFFTIDNLKQVKIRLAIESRLLY